MSPRLIDVETERGMEYWLSSEITDLFLTYTESPEEIKLSSPHSTQFVQTREPNRLEIFLNHPAILSMMVAITISGFLYALITFNNAVKDRQAYERLREESENLRQENEKQRERIRGIQQRADQQKLEGLAIPTPEAAQPPATRPSPLSTPSVSP